MFKDKVILSGKFAEHIRKIANFQRKSANVSKAKGLGENKRYVFCKVIGQGLLVQSFMETTSFYEI